MSIRSLAVVGKRNEPLYLREFSESSSDTYSDADLFGLPSLADTEANAVRSGGSKCSIRQQFILNAALDRVEELDGPPPGLAWRDPGVKGADAMWLGLLSIADGLRVYGFVTTTHIKLLVAIEDDVSPELTEQQEAKDKQIKSFLANIHELYVEYMLNPFNDADGGAIQSNFFDEGVQEWVETFNKNAIRTV